MEPTEIDEFRKQVEEGGESGLSYVSLAISILAVLVAMVTVLGHRTHTAALRYHHVYGPATSGCSDRTTST